MKRATSMNRATSIKTANSIEDDKTDKTDKAKENPASDAKNPEEVVDEMAKMLKQLEIEKKIKRRQERAERKKKRELEKKRREWAGGGDDSDEDSDTEESEKSTIEPGIEEEKSLHSNYLESNDVASAIFGTSKGSMMRSKSSPQKNRRLMEYDDDDDEDEEEDDDLDTINGVKQLKKPKKSVKPVKQKTKDSDDGDAFGYVKISSLYNETENNKSKSKYSDEQDLDDFMPDTITVFQDKHDSEDPNKFRGLHSKLKKTAMTVLLTQKWRQSYKNRDSKKAALQPIKYQPTYRMESKISLKSLNYQIVKKLTNTLETLCEKHEKYDDEYTPRFLRIITEMIKNDAKSFKLERYKIISHVSILTKKSNQDIHFISRTMFNKEQDQRFCLKAETKGYYLICLVFFVYFD